MASPRNKTKSKTKPAAKAAPKAAAKTPSKATGIEARYLAALKALVPAHDLETLGNAELQVIARRMSAAAQMRKPGKHSVVHVQPEAGRHALAQTHTSFVVINDDMPFIIDSITAEINRQGYQTELLLHPIMHVLRDKGSMKAIVTAANEFNGDSDIVESHVYIRLEQVLSDSAAQQLVSALDGVLADVRLATSDWREMRDKVRVILDDEGPASDVTPSDRDEARAFLAYIRDNNFTFLGYRAYRFVEKKGRTVSQRVEGSDLGILKQASAIYFDDDNGAPEAEALAQSRWPIMVSKLIDEYATVHRHVPMDVVSARMLDKHGRLIGMHIFVGLFTSSTYSCRTADIPIVRQKVRDTIDSVAFKPGSHDAKALEHILEKMPRDELLQASPEEVRNLALGILRLQTKPRVALFTHLDPMKQYMSCLVYVPRDRYNTTFRTRATQILEAGINGRVTNYFTSLDDSALARILFTVRLDRPDAQFDADALEKQLIDMGREWHESLYAVLVEREGRARGSQLAKIYGRAFTTAYHESIDINNAVHDIRQLETLRHQEAPIRLELYRLNDAPENSYRLKVYNRKNPVPLAEILPLLDNMGLKALDETPFEVRPEGSDEAIWMHDFGLQGAPGLALDQIKHNFEETFVEVWRGRAESDGLNALVLLINLSWREVLMLRAYNNYLRQARFPYSRRYVEQVLVAYPHITRELVSLFHALHDPRGKGKANGQAEKIVDMLQAVDKLDHDKILRQMMSVIQNTLRTNYYQPKPDGTPRSLLAMKLNSREIPDLPLPRPHVEISVYSARVEAIHLRGGEIARGGIRWSDRPDDFRTEVLGLLKAQMVKNTVIVPVGAKGGFVVKQPPQEGGRPAYLQEGIECYKLFVQSMLDITDNIVAGKITRPKNVVCHDGTDPYLVVAADKGTATFSDIANSLSVASNFWLGDAFASGGSAGYDHKKMGITARGGWESVKRHFRELGKDIQKEDFTVAGVGDMGGDVFGNAMLLSKHIKLVAAFNHVHIFIDPTPDAAISFAERQRLFDARGGWDQYDKAKISAGGAVFERSAKSVKLTAQMKKLFNLSVDSMTPDELIRIILQAEVELMWFGGIGTYIKSARQSQADADDKANDNLRVDGRDVRAKVIGEGANMGVTQLGRIEYARQGFDGTGGRINTDFIDNSAGVDCSDHEVNIKILLADVTVRRKMTRQQRDKLLEKMTADVAALVLRDNYQQTQALSFQQLLAAEQINLHLDLVRQMQRSGLLNRQLEGLPDDEGFARLSREGQGLSRPELCVLTSYAKIDLYNHVLKTAIPDDATLHDNLVNYFPSALHGYDKEISAHKLRREIVATDVVNTLINRMGPVFVSSRIEKTGASVEDVVRAFLIVCRVYGVDGLWAAIEKLDNKVPAATQLAALNEIYVIVKRAVTWFLRFGREGLPLAGEVARFSPAVHALARQIDSVLPPAVQQKLAASQAHFEGLGLPADVSLQMALLKQLSSAADIVQIADNNKVPVERVAHSYFTLGETLGFDWLRNRTHDLVTENSWQARVKSAVLDDLYHHQATLTAALLPKPAKAAKAAKGKKATPAKGVAGIPAAVLAQSEQLVNEIRHQEIVRLEMLVLVTQRLGQMVSACH